jgi:hypothetical protein
LGRRGSFGAGVLVTKRLLLACLLLGSAASAHAADEQQICADRPGKATPTCTVPAGMVQVESGLADWSRDSSGGARTDELDIGGTAVKFGVTDRLHLELDLPPYIDISRGPSGLGDSAVALKYRLTDGSAPVQFAIRPFVKIPTANHSLGNGKVEGGIALLADSTFGKSSVGWDVAPEVDLVADSDGSGYHVATTAAASVGVPLSARLNVSGELWGAWDFDPAGTVRQYSLDAAIAYLLGNNAQLDAGANFGLNRNTPDVELYTGLAIRF